MADKVLHEIRFIETDEGYRIEVNGDKEKLRKMGFGPGMFGFGPGMGRRHRHGGHRRGPWGRHHRGHRRGHGHGHADAEQAESAPDEKAPAA